MSAACILGIDMKLSTSFDHRKLRELVGKQVRLIYIGAANQ